MRSGSTLLIWMQLVVIIIIMMKTGDQLDFLSLINPLCEEIDENSYQPSLSVNELWKLLEESKCLQLSILECYTVCSQKYSRNLQSIIYLVVGAAL